MYEDHDFMILRLGSLYRRWSDVVSRLTGNKDEAVAMEIPLLTFITYHLEMEVEETEFTKTAQSTLFIMMLISIIRA